MMTKGSSAYNQQITTWLRSLRLEMLVLMSRFDTFNHKSCKFAEAQVGSERKEANVACFTIQMSKDHF